jgi:hypothetical protein
VLGMSEAEFEAEWARLSVVERMELWADAVAEIPFLTDEEREASKGSPAQVSEQAKGER